MWGYRALPSAYDDTVQWIPFLIQSFVTHLGDEIDTGLHRACLIESEDGMAWLTEDGVQGQPVSLPDPTLQESCYLAVRLHAEMSLQGILSWAKSVGMLVNGPGESAQRPFVEH